MKSTKERWLFIYFYIAAAAAAIPSSQRKSIQSREYIGCTIHSTRITIIMFCFLSLSLSPFMLAIVSIQKHFRRLSFKCTTAISASIYCSNAECWCWCFSLCLSLSRTFVTLYFCSYCTSSFYMFQVKRKILSANIKWKSMLEKNEIEISKRMRGFASFYTLWWCIIIFVSRSGWFNLSFYHHLYANLITRILLYTTQTHWQFHVKFAHFHIKIRSLIFTESFSWAYASFFARSVHWILFIPFFRSSNRSMLCLSVASSSAISPFFSRSDNWWASPFFSSPLPLSVCAYSGYVICISLQFFY